MTRDTTDGSTDVSPRLADRLVDRAIPLDTTDPSAPLGDLRPVLDRVADARVIGLGEATHGTREFFRFKHRLVRGLVEQRGLRLFAIEANLPETLAMNEYVLRGRGDPWDALDGTYFWTWDTEEVLALAEWLRAFNERRPLADRVRFHGVDAQFTAGAADRLAAFLDRVDPALGSELGRDLRHLDDSGEAADDGSAIGARLDAADRVSDRLSAAFDRNGRNYADATSERAVERARRLCRVVEQARDRTRSLHEDEGYERSMRIRDRAMAENAAWLLEYESADRLALWAHDCHVCRTENRASGVDAAAASTGNHLAARYGDEYYALGFDFLGGTFQAVGGPDDERRLAERSLADPPADSVTRLFAATGAELLFADLDALRDDADLAAWLGTPRSKRSLGAVYYGADGPADGPGGPAVHNERRDLTGAFDGLAFVRETTRARPVERPD